MTNGIIRQRDYSCCRCKQHEISLGYSEWYIITPLKKYEFFISGIFYLIFLDYGRLWITEISEGEYCIYSLVTWGHQDRLFSEGRSLLLSVRSALYGLPSFCFAIVPFPLFFGPRSDVNPLLLALSFCIIPFTSCILYSYLCN